jgi:hypothetical protein
LSDDRIKSLAGDEPAVVDRHGEGHLSSILATRPAVGRRRDRYRRLIQINLTMSRQPMVVPRPSTRAEKVQSPEKLRELAAWYREFAERTQNPTIWDARLRTAEDLESEAQRLEERAQRQRHMA